MNSTERSIFEQFPLWSQAPAPQALPPGPLRVVVGCGTSYYLAQSVAAALNASGRRALAVPGGEWSRRPQAYVPTGEAVQVLALSRSGESTETVQAAQASRAAGHEVLALTCEPGSSLTRHADTVLCAQTHPEEGIVMTASASLMLLMGLRLAGVAVDESTVEAARALLDRAEAGFRAVRTWRSHLVFLGGGALYGIAQEGALKLQEMSLTYTQAYHPLEYRHGPISLVDERTLAVLLYSPDTASEEATLAAELRAKGAQVMGFGGPGDLHFELPTAADTRGLTCLPALQLLGERIAQGRGLDSRAPRHLTKVVTLA